MSRFTAAYHVNGQSAQQLTERQASTGTLNTVNPTYTNDLGLLANASNNYNPFGHPHDLSFSGLPSLAALNETPTRMQNRTTTSVLGYNQTNREHSRHRASRWLVLVLPPAFITQSQAVFGHTLASGPSSRLSQGLLMPLYPTMYAQLGAIAREFNFPNIVGISLYMHVDEAGTLFTPRISEESWGILWGHLFEPNTPSPNGGLPISGRIEFDIDAAKARWFDSWASTSRRETASLGSLSPTHVASMHQQQESKTTVNFEDVQERSQAAVGAKNGIGYTPKRLSLLERFDSNNSSPPMPLPIMEPTPVIAPVPMPKPYPATPPAKKPVLSTAVQEEPAISHKKDIDNRVKSWRASATFKQTLLASTGQLSLDPANMPNTVPLDDPVNEVDEARTEVNPKDYSWSITSAGPPSVLDSPISTPSYQPSVHMDRRAAGSVPLTPETCTSWGPEDYDPHSPVLSEFRLPSPDLGQRNLEHCPMTPTTATSWGPPSEYPPSPDPESQWARAPSLDLGQRTGWSRPATPSTATSWGPPSEYPPSPQLESQWAYFRPSSVDLGRRAEGSRPVTPSTATSWGPPEEWPPTPTTLSRVSTPDHAQQSFSFAEEVGGLAPRSKAVIPELSGPWSFVWPYLRPGESSPKSMGSGPGSKTVIPGSSGPWNFVWPYLSLSEQSPKSPGPGRSQVAPLSDPTECRRRTVVAERVAYPVIKIYPAVYPHFDIYPSVRGNCTDANGAPRDLSGTMTIQTQGRIPPESPSVSNSGLLEAGRIGYPSLSIYPAVYPYLVIYPKVQTVEIKCSDHGQGSKPNLPSGPNDLETQPWGIGPRSSQPDSSPVPIRSSVLTREALSPVLRSGMAYPVFSIYPAVYPFFDVYPTVERYAVSQPSKAGPRTVLSVTSKAITGTKLGYPVMKIYNAVYPHFDIYPRVDYHVHKPESHRSCRRFPDVPKTTVSVRLQVVYPAFDIYPTVYPYLTIYPAVTGVSKPVHPTPVPCAPNIVKSTGVHSKLGYPSLVIYPSVYPWIDVYPSIAGGITRPPSQTTVRQPRTRLAAHPRTRLRKRFTADEDAPPVPKLPDYATLRALSQSFLPSPQRGRTLSLQEPFAYPVLSIYPPVYPYFDIYPAVAGGSSPRQPRGEQRLTSSSGKFRVVLASVKLEAAYPRFDIYPAVYPNFDIYPTIEEAVMETKTKAVAPTGQASNTPRPSYPVIQIYKPVYPYFDIYPSWSGTQGNPQHKNHALHHKLSLRSTESPKRTPFEPVSPSGPAYPIIRIYNPVYPYFDIYPSWVRAQTVPVVKHVFKTRKPRRELHEEVLTASPIKPAEFASQPEPVLTSRYPLYPAYPTFEIYKAAYPHFNIYPSHLRVPAPPVGGVSRPEGTHKCHKELHNEVALRIPTTIPGDRGIPIATDRVSFQPHELPIVAKQQELVDEPGPLPSLPTVPPLRLRRRLPSLDQLNGQDSSPPRPRVSPVFDGFPSIEKRLSQLKGEMTEASGPAPKTLKRSQSLYTQPTPKRRQSALILQRIKALNEAAESPEPVLDRPVRRSTRSLPITPTRA